MKTCTDFIIWLFIAVARAYCYDIFNHVYYPHNTGTILETDTINTLPKIHTQYRRREHKTKFTGVYNGSYYTSHEANNQDVLLDSSSQLSWETVSPKSGRRVATYIKLEDLNSVRQSTNNKPNNLYFGSFKKQTRSKRNRRNIYGRDDRSFIPPNENFGLTEPYVYTVKLSTGCTGIVISPRHVLTAAHCVHDQKDYVEGTKDIKVGFLKSDKTLDWVSVKSMKVSKGWIEGGVKTGPFYDYALLKLTNKHNRPYISLSISESEQHGVGERISFTGFDDDKPENTMWYRSCTVVEDDPSFLYHYCDAKPGSSGSGVYSWVYDDNAKEWKRALVGVFSGNRWRIYDEFYIVVRNFNVAVRLTASRYAQICKWLGKTADKVCIHTTTKQKR